MQACFRYTGLHDLSRAPPSLVLRHGKVITAGFFVLVGVVATALARVDGARAVQCADRTALRPAR
jgi:hypothetical protein